MIFLQITFLCLHIFPTSYQINNTAVERLFSISHSPTSQKWNNESVSSFDYAQEYYSNDSYSSLPKWSNWSSWSKCRKCIQKRMKLCLHSSCEFTKFDQERHCKMKRCKRRRNQQENFNVVMPEKGISPKMGDYSIWGSWSTWSRCSQSCRTFRKRYCKKPGRCKKKRQIENAYCYHGATQCEMLVFNLMQEKKNHFEKIKYAYNNKITRRRRVMGSSMRCGMQYRKTKMLKIIGGTESPRYKWPWHVALINQYAEVFCGGTLIAPEWVLTASHCIRSFLIVRLNEHDLKYTDGREKQLVVHKVFQHPQFSARTVNGDIALLQLPVPVRTPVACLPNKKPIPKQMCSVMGWGKTRTHARHGVTRLRETQIPIVEDEICKWAYRDLLITDNMVCAGWVSGKSDTCAGDSGGGLICPHKRSNTGRMMYSVQGITSFGKGCGKRNKYGIYTVVFNYLDWIEYIMNRYRIS